MNQETIMKGNHRHRTLARASGAVALAATLATAGCAAQGHGDRSGHGAPATVSEAATRAPVPSETPRPTAWDLADVLPVWVQPGEVYVPVPDTVAPTEAPATVKPPATSAPATPRKAPTSAPAPRKTTTAPQTPKPEPKEPVTASVPSKAPAKPVAGPAPVGDTIRIGSWSHGYVTAYGSQATVDKCHVVEWSPHWFAGHDHCGYAFWASLGIGRTITLTGSNAGTYTVTHRAYLPDQGGKAPYTTFGYDLVLQTCKGSGTQLVYATRTG